MIPYGRQNISSKDILNVKKVLRSDFLTQGPVVPVFERAVKRYCGASHAVAVNSATSALHIACVALNLGPNDWLWTSPNTFVASANCGRYCGAKIDFVDIDINTYNMSISALKEKLKISKKKGKLPKVVIPVHFAGQPCDMITIKKLSKKYGFKIIEDASHAIGASYHKNKIGSCKYSDITVFSFHPVKIITTGEGGMALTNNKRLAERLYRLRNSGITRNKLLMKNRPKNEIWNYQQIELGLNYRMTDIQAALGLSQLNRIDKFVRERHKIVDFYEKNLVDLPLKKPWQLPGTYSSYHLYPICIDFKKTRKTQRNIYNFLHKNKIKVNLHYIPVHRHPYYESLGFKKGDFPVSEDFHRKVISLPIFPALKKNDCKKILNKILLAFK